MNKKLYISRDAGKTQFNTATMKYQELRYLWAYIIPAILVVVLAIRGWMSFGGIIVAFVIIPFLELLLPGTDRNLPAEEEAKRLKNPVFDIMLYLNVPFVIAMVTWFLYLVTYVPMTAYEYWGISLSMGVFLGAMGINVAHELGHRNTWYEQLMASILLLPNLYMHFTIEHNNGHHVNIATKEDPASARYNEWVYVFWLRSVIFTYISAWKIEAKRLHSEGKPPLHYHNRMIWLQLIQALYLSAIWWFLGVSTLLAAIAIAVGGFLVLETVNYIEHYGLSRRKMPSGRYERVQPWHSWNSNHRIGRIVLYELTRHSDHHFKASRKYQVLRHFDESPQLPFGYPMSMILALCPPLWFSIMNPRVKQVEQKAASLPMS